MKSNANKGSTRGNGSVGAGIKRYRLARKWSLKDLGERCGIPISTLSKVENGQMSLKIEKLMAVSEALDVDIMQLVSPVEKEAPRKVVTGRRSVTRRDQAVTSRTENSIYEHHAHELSNRLLVPAVIEVLPDRQPDLLKHQGEEFIFVLEGRVEALTEFYEPTVLEAGDSMYIDSTMAHNLRALDGKPARVLNVSSASRREPPSEHNG